MKSIYAYGYAGDLPSDPDEVPHPVDLEAMIREGLEDGEITHNVLLGRYEADSDNGRALLYNIREARMLYGLRLRAWSIAQSKRWPAV